MTFGEMEVRAKAPMYCKIACNPLILFAFWGRDSRQPERTKKGVVLMPAAKKRKAKKAPKAKKAKKAKKKRK